MATTDAAIVALYAPISALLGAALGATGAYIASGRQAKVALAVATAHADTAHATSRRQVRASTIIASRQRWIDELRSELSAFSASLLALQMALEKQTDEAREEWIAEVLRASMLEAKVALMLNPGEPAHEALLESIMIPLNALRNGVQLNWGDASLLILERGRPVLKEAWDRSRSEAEELGTEALASLSRLT
jgi:hypothetical protein